ncbi:LamG-like jellyroll fold domain-containing protein [Aquimarina rhabdastrellae]
MKNTILNILNKALIWIVFSTVMTGIAQSNRPAVLQIRGANNYTSHFDTQTRLDADLIQTGETGKATIEFWAKAAKEPHAARPSYAPWTLSNLLTGSDEFSVAVSASHVNVTVGEAVNLIELNGQDQLFNDTWHHFALVFNTTANNVRVYIDGVERSLIQYASIAPEFLYMTIDPQDQLFVAEYRAWNKARTRAQIEEMHYRSLFNETTTSLEGFYSQGLVIAYVNDVFEEAVVANLPALENTSWKNALTALDREEISTVESFITSNYVGGKRFAELRNDAEHPIYELADILLVASDGNGLDARISGGRNGVELRWPHIKGAIAYRILRKNVQEVGEPIEIETKSDVANNIVSEYIRVFDQDILPNELYEYTVQAIKEDNVRGNSGQDVGFVFANGEVNGTIKTALDVATQTALVEAIPVNGDNPGSALEFTTESSPIIINEVEDFRRANYTGMIEFWYKTPETPRADNTIFKLGAAEIHMDQNGINIQLDDNEYIAATRIIERDEDGNIIDKDVDNTDWHHYAFVYGPNGGKIYIDGGIKPTGAETEVKPNETVTAPFTVDLRNTASFSFNEEVNQKYQIDEIRIWKEERTTLDIIRYANHIIAGRGDQGQEAENLMAYYRLDLDDTNRIYNQAPSTRGRLVGISTSELTHLEASEQPKITYGTYTDKDGRYNFVSLNSGRQNSSSIGNAFEYRIRPSKPNHSFMPEDRVVDVDRVLQPNSVQADFTDVSALPISGRIVYRVPDTSEEDGYAEYPTLIGTGIVLDGTVVNSTSPDAKVTTNNDGVYVITASPGNHTIGVAPQVAVSEDDIDSNQDSLDKTSLDFDGETGYAVSSKRLTIDNTQAFTWSGFINPDIEVDSNVSIPAVQTILQWGELVLELRDNNRLQVVLNGTDTTLSTIIDPNQAEYDFFALTVDPKNTTIALYVNGDYRSDVLSAGLAIDDKIYVGAKHTDDLENPLVNFSRANLDILEYRTEAYTADELRDIRRGRVIEKDKEHLNLSYTFEHLRGTRVLNLAVDSTTTENLFLQLEGGASFTKSTVAYTRAFKFEYKVLNERYIPEGEEDSDTYGFPVLEAISSLNFENLSRRSFIGNIVVPCDNGVGKWSGKIVRTDIAFPEFEVEITDNHFNLDRTIFTVNDLLPGQYRVEITNENSGRLIQSSTIDLREANKTFDFSYRNKFEVVTTFYNYTAEDVENEVVLTDTELQNRLINPTCGADESIYNLEAGKGVLISVEVFERYGENKCPVENANVNLAGSMITTNINSHTNEIGRANFVVNLGSPKFDGDYLRKLNIDVGHDGRSKNENEVAYLTGAQRGNSDFTLVSPTVGFILHDPPGDGSSSTLERGSSYSFSNTVEGGTDLTASFTATPAGIATDTRMVTLVVAAPLGAGTAVGTSTQIVEASANPEIGSNTSATYRRTTGNTYGVTLNQSISTPTADDYVGEDADVFVGTSQVLTFGTGRNLKVKNCIPDIDRNDTIVTADKHTPFVFTRQQIEDEIIKDLQRIAIRKYDELNGTTQNIIDERNTLDLDGTIESFNIDIEDENTDKTLGGYLYEINTWKTIVSRRTREEKEEYFSKAPTFSSTTKDLKVEGDDRLGDAVTQLDGELSVSSLLTVTYNINREVGSSEQNSGSVTTGISGGFSTENKIFGVRFSLRTELGISGTVGGSDGTNTSNSRTDSFTVTDDDSGDQIDFITRRHPLYDTPMFLTTSGQSSCPFESGTVPRQGVEIEVDRNVAYGTGDETLLYNLTLRNTQVAADATPKRYIVAMDGASNPLGAVVLLNESPIFEPATSSPFVFGTDGTSDTGVRKEITAQLRIGKGTDAPSDISYENIKIRIYAECEQDGFNYASYRVDEYQEVGVVPFHEIEVSAHFSGACIEEVIPDQPAEDWVVNNTDNDELEFRFRIPEVANDTAPEGFTVDLEYAIQGNNTPRILKSVSLQELKDNLQNDGYITYTADVASLPDGTYSFRVTPVCDDGGAGLPSSRMNPTPYVEGRIARQAPTVVSTNPVLGGVLTDGTISATFTSAINPVTATSSNISLRGILGGTPRDLISAEFAEINDEVTIPHQPQFDLEGAYTIEMWVNPSKRPRGTNVPIIKKGDNYKIELMPSGKILVNETVMSSIALQPFTWTHITAIYDGANAIQIYFNGASAGSGVYNGLTINEMPITIATPVNGDAYVGLLDEVRIWTEARSVLEIASNMDKQLIGNETNLLAYYVFDKNAPEGEDGAQDEAIRDFTGRATGTTENGLDFVIGEEVAAPLDITKMVQELQFTLSASVNNTVLNIVPVLTNQELEGAKLTAMINDRKLEDPEGNLIQGVSWDFIINRNTIQWSQNNIRVEQTQGESTLIDTIDLVNEEGGTDISYKFVSLPGWITVVDGADPEDTNIITAGTTNRELEFQIAPYLNAGIHTANVNIETFNADTGERLGTETFTVEVEVTCAAPDYSFNSRVYSGNMVMTGKVIIGGIQSVDPRDEIVAYLDGEIRGSAHVESNGLVNLFVYGKIGDTGALNFRVWDASECEEYQGIIETYNFELDGLLGSDSPVTMTVGEQLTRRINIVPGFQDVSFNVRDNETSFELSLTSLEGLTEGDMIFDRIDRTKKLTVNTDGELEGNITAIDVRRVYEIQSVSATNKTLLVSGIQVPIGTDLEIVGNRVINGVPFYPNELQRIRFALRSLTSEDVAINDRIQSRDLYAQYTEEGWKGTLTHLTPGQGYIYRSKNNGTLNYSGIIGGLPDASSAANLNKSTVNNSEMTAAMSFKEKAKTIGWEMNPNAYPSFMYVNGVLASNTLDESQSYMIAAFINDEVRGVAKAEFSNGQFHYYIGIGGIAEGEVNFKLFNGEEILELDNKEAFVADEILGNDKNPYVLSFTKNITSAPAQLGFTLSQNVPNPLVDQTMITYSVPEDTFVDISLYNVLGQKVHTFVAEKVKGNIKHTIDWNGVAKGKNLTSGIYLYQMTTPTKTLQRKLVIK